MLANATQERFGQRMPRAVGLLVFESVTPPLQPDLARERLLDHVADTGDFRVKGIERRERVALLCRRKQTGQVAIAVGVPQGCENLITDCCTPSFLRTPHTAINAAATARDSASITL